MTGEKVSLNASNQLAFRVDKVGQVADASYEVVRKFGRATVSTTFTPVCWGGYYQVPQTSAAKALRVAGGGDVADASGGAGAWKIRVVGLDETLAEASSEITLDGSTASSLTATTFTRINRVFVTESGTYADASTGSHVGDITIEASSGETWAVIDSTDFPRGQSEIGAYSIPSGKTAYIDNLTISVATSKIASVIGFQRTSTDASAAPYDGMRAFMSQTGIVDTATMPSIFGPFVGPCDFGFMARVTATTGEVDVSFNIKIYG